MEFLYAKYTLKLKYLIYKAVTSLLSATLSRLTVEPYPSYDWEISRLLNRRQETIRAWMNAFGKLGLGGLGIAFGRGRKAIIRIGAVMEAIKKK